MPSNKSYDLHVQQRLLSNYAFMLVNQVHSLPIQGTTTITIIDNNQSIMASKLVCLFIANEYINDTNTQ